MKKHGPLYVRLAAAIEKQVREGLYLEGEFLPSERDLEEQHGVTRITVRGALRLLSEKGIVRREHGRGTRLLRVPNKHRTFAVLFTKWRSP